MTDSSSNNETLAVAVTDETHDREYATYRVRNRESVTDAVVRAVSSKAQFDSNRVPPLYSAVDPDSLNRLFANRKLGPRPNRTIGFPYAGHHVQVNSDRAIEVASLTRQ